ncbi:MAG: DNA polymerase/3'-5' exonuclease PolX [Candidatus Woesearchaeota archaeon]
MENREIAEILFELADLMELVGIKWKPIAFRKAGRALETMTTPVADIYQKGGIKALEELPGVGAGIAARIEELLKTGKLREYERLKKKIPHGVEEITHIMGVGPKKAARLYKELGIASIEQLETAAKTGKIRELAGFGERSEQDILRGIEMLKRGKERHLLGTVLPIARALESRLKELPYVKVAQAAGSVRRRKETVADIDILVISKKAGAVMDFFTSMPDVEQVLAKGPTKSTVILKNGIQADVRVLEESSFGAALQYFTGSVEHNVRLRQIAIKKGYKLNEYGLFKRSGEYVAGRTEAEVYKALGLPYIEPELRENTGEIEAAAKHKLPKLIGYGDIRGDLHVHTNWSDGMQSIEEMVNAARALGYDYVIISDHSKSQRIAHGMEEKRLLKQLSEIDKIARKMPDNFRIFKGLECDILPDGSLDFGNNILKQLDIVIGSVHSRFKSPAKEMTRRIVKALENPYLTILGHPTGRLINVREPYAVEFEKICQAAVENGKWLEINSYPERLDLKDSHIRIAKSFGAKFVISTDSHHSEHLKYIEYGIAQARRGWLEKGDVLNALPLSKVEKLIKR